MRIAPYVVPRSWLPLVIMLAAGCDAESSSRVPVRGKISYQGKPLAAGLIVFAPDVTRGNDGPLARSEVRSDGTYDLQTDGTAGVNPGWYRVTVLALEPQPPSPGQAPAPPRSLLPDKYRDPELSGLVRQVKAGQENQLDFNLE